jgi:hypothetical protein
MTLPLSAGVVVWALVGLPGAPTACLPDACDCEAVGPGPVRQPANAWSSLALTATGLFFAIASPGGAGGGARAAGPSGGGFGVSPAGPGETRSRSERRGGSHARVSVTRDLAAAALLAAGLGAFLYHAGLTAWAARLDGITVTLLIGALILHATARAAAMRARERRRGFPWRQLAPWPLLTLGALCWWLGRSGGAWCRPDAWLPAHTAWHLLAAVAIGLWLGGPRAGSGKQPASPGGL